MKLICKNCGFEKVEISINIDTVTCSLCGGNMLMQKDIDKLSVKTDIVALCHEIAQDSMKHNINTLGNDKVWDIINSNFRKSITRVAYRKLFFKAGGYVPEINLQEKLKKEGIIL